MTAVHVIKSESEISDILNRIVPRIAQHAIDRDFQGLIANEAIELIAQSGLLALNVPKEFGGVDASAVSIANVCQKIAEADPSVSQLFQPHFAAVDALSRVGTVEQQQKFFHEVLDGAWIGNGTNEIGVPRGEKHLLTKLQALDDGSGYVLNGKKFYSTGASIARWIAVMAKDPHDRLGVAYVHRDAIGLTIEQDWNSFGQRGTSSGTTEFKDVFISKENFVERWRIFEQPQCHGAFGQLHHIALDLGIMDAALKDAVTFVRDKSRPSAESPYTRNTEDPVVIRNFGEFDIQRRAAQALLETAARTYDLYDAEIRNPSSKEAAEQAAAEVSLAIAAAKTFTAQNALTISSHIFEHMGASGTDRRFAYDRHWRNTRTHSLHDPIRWKIHHLGNFRLNGILPPNSGIL